MGIIGVGWKVLAPIVLRHYLSWGKTCIHWVIQARLVPNHAYYNSPLQCPLWGIAHVTILYFSLWHLRCNCYRPKHNCLRLRRVKAGFLRNMHMSSPFLPRLYYVSDWLTYQFEELKPKNQVIICASVRNYMEQPNLCQIFNNEHENQRLQW